MRRPIVIVIAGGVLLAVLLLWLVPPGAKRGGGQAVVSPEAAGRGEPADSSSVARTTSARMPAILKGRPLASPLPPAPRVGVAAPNPDGNIVDIEIVDGLAIAYGDQIIGVPEDAGKLKRARAEAGVPKLWPEPRIPYSLQVDLPNGAEVAKAVEYFKAHSPVEWVPWSGENDGVIFMKGESHCYSFVGRVGGVQPIRIAPECKWPEILHEMMHALGFVHEQSRTDRDRYVEVLWENIVDEFRPQYAQVPESFEEAIRGAPFDLKSVMMYRTNEFAARPTDPTMRSKSAETIEPVAEGLSLEDVRRLYRLYRPGDVPRD